MRVDVKPELIRWARERAGVRIEALEKDFPKFSDWEKGELQPTLKQLEKFANKVYVPLGTLFLSQPPVENLPIPDFRKLPESAFRNPSLNLLDTIYMCQERQDWYREFAKIHQEPLSFIQSASIDSSPKDVAAGIQKIIGFTIEERSECTTYEEALRFFIQRVEKTGILVMVSGFVRTNTRRTLDPNEFRGFVLSDNLAPLIFINGKDGKAAQMFTLAHEIAHLWLGESGLSNAEMYPVSGYTKKEIWCNKVSAELLVPLDVMRGQLIQGETSEKTLERLRKYFKVSRFVILRRLLDIGHIKKEEFESLWKKEKENSEIALSRSKRSGGGNYYATKCKDVSPRFAEAIITSTLEGQTLYRDAFHMLGVSKMKSFEGLREKIGV